MSKANVFAPSLRPDGKDRWGLRPRKGHVRGWVCDVRYVEEQSVYGDFTTIEFNVLLDEHGPKVPVLMRGTHFTHPVRADKLVDVPDPDPSVRPILARRLYDPSNGKEILVSYYPGVDDRPRRERYRAAALIFGPFLALGLLFGLWRWILG